MLFWRRSAVQVKESVDAAELIKALSKLRAQVEALQEAHEGLHAMHLKLRGRVYARWGKADDDPDAPRTADTSRLTKDQLRAQLTLTGRTMPGRPTVHD